MPHLSKLIVVVALHLVGCAGLGGAIRHPRTPEAWQTYWSTQHRDDMAATALGPPRRVGHGQTVLLFPGMTIGVEMFATMAHRLERDGFHVVLYQDPQLLTDGVIPSARRLAARVQQLLDETGEDHIDIVAQCVGGVVASYYVRMMGSGHVDHLVTFVSPHHGSLPAAIAATVTGWQGLHDIRRGSAVVRSLDAHPLPAGVRFTSIYSCHDRLLLPYDTAAVADAHNIELCGRPLDHFAEFWDPSVYAVIADSLADRDDEVALGVAHLNAR